MTPPIDERARITLKSPEEISLMRRAGSIVAATLEAVRRAVRPGVTTAELDAIAGEEIRTGGGIPSFKGYLGYPATICVSINDELVHGIPGDRVIHEGDIVSIDAGAIYQGFQGDAATTIPVNPVPAHVQRLIDVTRESLETGIRAARAGARLGVISHSIQEYIEAQGFGVVREYVGHGIGQRMHEEPQVPNFGPADRGIFLKKGLTLALEPMITVGDWHTRLHADGWTVSTRDGSLSAHFEHTIAITDGEAEVLTAQ